MASNLPSSELTVNTTMEIPQELENFRAFSKLPLELRSRIWRSAFKQAHRLFRLSRPQLPESYGTQYRDLPELRARTMCNTPLHDVNREARAEIGRSSTPAQSPLFQAMKFNPSNDTVYIRPDMMHGYYEIERNPVIWSPVQIVILRVLKSLQTYAEQLHGGQSDMDSIQHLAIGGFHPGSWEISLDFILQNLKNLKSLTILVSKKDFKLWVDAETEFRAIGEMKRALNRSKERGGPEVKLRALVLGRDIFEG